MLEKLYENQIKIALIFGAAIAVFLLIETTFSERRDVSAVYIGNSNMEISMISNFINNIAKSSEQEKDSFFIKPQTGVQLSLSNHLNHSEPGKLLAKDEWDYIFLQEHGIETLSSEGIDRLASVINDLSKLADPTNSKLIMVSTWPEQQDHPVYGWQPGTQYERPESPESMNQRIEDANRYIANINNLDIVPVGSAFEKARTDVPAFQLYKETPQSDSNNVSRPSLHGIYLTALMIYDYLSDVPLSSVTYIPTGLSREDVENLKRIAVQMSSRPEKLAGLSSVTSQ